MQPKICWNDHHNHKPPLNNHRTAIKNKKNFKISEHFNLPTHIHRDLQIGVIEKRSTNIREIKTKEAFWIRWLNTVISGLNQKDEGILHLNPHSLHTAGHYEHSLECTPYLISYISEAREGNL